MDNTLKEVLLDGAARQIRIRFPESDREEITSGIATGSAKLQCKLNSKEELNFGECNAAQFSVEIDDIDDITGEVIQVYALVEGYTPEVPIFYGRVYSAKRRPEIGSREIVAYDFLYDRAQEDVTSWYRTLFASVDSMTLLAFRTALFTHMGIQQETVTLMNDAVSVQKMILKDDAVLTFGDCVTAICQMNACFGHVSPSGGFEYVSLGENIYDYSANYQALKSSYEEYAVAPIDRIRLYDGMGNISVAAGTGTNTWNLANNFLLYGLAEETLIGIANRLMAHVGVITYVPVRLDALISLPIEPGSKINVTTHTGDTFSTYALDLTYSGSQLVDQEISATGKELRDSSLSTDDTLILLDLRLQDTQSSVEEAYDEAAAAQTTANNAMTAANGKTKIFYQNDAPAAGMAVGDMWFDTDGGNAIYQYTTNGWVLRQLGSGSLAANSVTAVEINVATLSAITANIGTVTAGVLRSSDYQAPTGSSVYSTAGMIIDLDNKVIRTPKTAILSDGSIYSSSVDLEGKITATSGSIGPWTISSSAIYNGRGSIYSVENGVCISLNGIGGQTNDGKYTLTPSGTLTLTDRTAADEQGTTSAFITLEKPSKNESVQLSSFGLYMYRYNSQTDYYNASIGIAQNGNTNIVLRGTDSTIIFSNATGSEIIYLSFSDSDVYQAPSSIALTGNQGNEYFIAPNIKAESGLYIGTTSVANAVTNITRSGTTFTATRLDGTTFTFTQQDNNSVTGVKGNSESSYRTGNVNITPANIGALALTGGTMTGAIKLAGVELNLGTYSTATNDSGDIVWLYGNGTEKMRIWTDNEYTAKKGPNYRVYNASGTALYSGQLVITDGTGASGTWGINVTGYSKTVLDAGNNTNTTTFAYSKAGLNYADFTWLAAWNGYELRAVNKSQFLASSGGTLTGNLSVSATSSTVERAVTVSTGNVSGAVRANNGGSGGAFGLYVTKTGGTARTGTWLSAMDSGGTYHANWTSDEREKNVFGLMGSQEAETLLRSVDIINFSYKSDQNQIIQNGMVAQQIRDVLNKNGIGYRSYLNIIAVKDDDFRYDLNAPESEVRYGIDYARLTPILWKGWQLHDDRITALEKENEALKAEIKALKGAA